MARVKVPSSGKVEKYLFQEYTGQEEPRRVERPLLGIDMIGKSSVQVWYDVWCKQDRILRYKARCVTCERPVWGFDDGDNDPRGVLGGNSAGFSLHAQDYDITGPSVGLCAICGNDSERYHMGLERARVIWRLVAGLSVVADWPND